MGFIKDGSVSGTLPTSQAFAVHYPGYPSSIDRAIQTLGGTDGIIKSRSSHTNRLELRFRPEDPYSHPAFGTLRHCNNFLLKISRTNDETSPDQNQGPPNQEVNPIHSEVVAAATEDKEKSPEEVQEDLSADIVAQVSEAYLFDGMVDYQHVLALHAEEARRKKRSWEDIQPKLERHGLMDVDQDDLLILVPPLFSNKDMPDNIVLKPSVFLSAKKKQESVVQQRWEMEIEPSLAIDFNIKVVPSSVYWEKYIAKDSEQWKCQMDVSTLFEERPIWIKESLISRLLKKGLQFRDHILRRLLFRVAYYFSNGPFQRFWIRKGYDPRKDPESRIYQRIDFRVPQSLRGYCDANVDTGTKHQWEEICAFQVFPFKCQVYLQLAELKDDFIQKEIGKPAKQKICSLATGWFSASCMKSLRLKIAMRFLSVYPKAGAESLLKLKSGNFAKSNRRQIHAKDRMSDEGQKISNTEVVDNGDKEEANGEDEEDDDDGNVGDDDEDDGDDDDEEDEEEVDFDNVEDGLEPYEGLNLADRINHSTQQQGNLHMDNESISRNYLQELFGSFPPSSEMGSSGLNLQAGDNSDEEYQIYEPYDDDGNYSDDDY